MSLLLFSHELDILVDIFICVNPILNQFALFANSLIPISSYSRIFFLIYDITYYIQIFSLYIRYYILYLDFFFIYQILDIRSRFSLYIRYYISYLFFSLYIRYFISNLDFNHLLHIIHYIQIFLIYQILDIISGFFPYIGTSKPVYPLESSSVIHPYLKLRKC